jgi:hypothetical protein
MSPVSPSDQEETHFLFEAPMEKPGRWRYKPLALYPDLYRTFAHLPTDPDAFLQFANKYGDLGVGIRTEKGGMFSGADPRYRWYEEQHHMSSVVDVLDALKNGDDATLSQWITVAKNGARFDRKWANGAAHYAWITTPEFPKSNLWEWIAEASSDEDARRRAAQVWLQEELNKAMARDDDGRAATTTRVLFDLNRKRMGVHIVPRSLLAAMWFQCANALTGGLHFRNCAHCGRSYEVSPEARRKQSIYCSDRCKVAAYRQRKKKQESDGQAQAR